MEDTENGVVRIVKLFVSMILASTLKFFKPETDPLSIIGLGLFIFFGLSFYYKLGRGIPVRELIILIALIQWVIAPILSYHFYTKSEFYYMIIDESRYMSFVIPATLALITGLLLPLRKPIKLQGENYIENPNYYFKRGQAIFIIGLLAFLIKPFTPAALGYFFLLLSYSSILGALYLLKANSRFKYITLAAAFAPIFAGAAESSVFHEMFIWGGFLVIMYTFINKSGVLSKTILLSFMVASIFLINAVKKDYREAVWSEQKDQPQFPGQEKTGVKGNAGQLIGMVNEKVGGSGIQSDYYQEFTDRLNQGWIIARIMYVVPQYEDFAHGETIIEGIYASLLPRFLSPNKAMSGGAKNFERFTGLALAGASMNLGIIGEAYANYGEVEGVIFMFIYGLFFNIVYWIILKRAQLKAETLLWLPFLFFYVIKAEEDFTSIFNQFVKSVVVMVILFYALNLFIREQPFLKHKPETI
ncbi:MAG: hypothetical protein HYU69_10755 [Bacteroidetes bacterium]|nr:hypothetical protein [Bacteroidota bacterium]